jgi:hypothetical protein
MPAAQKSSNVGKAGEIIKNYRELQAELGLRKHDHRLFLPTVTDLGRYLARSCRVHHGFLPVLTARAKLINPSVRRLSLML